MENEDKNTKQLILEKGALLLAEQGIEGLSMRKLGALVGVSQAAIYRHYANKDELLRAIIQNGYGRLVSALRAVLENEQLSPAQKVREAVYAYINFVLESPDLFKAVLLQDSSPARQQVHAVRKDIGKNRETFAMFIKVLSEGMAKGNFAPADPELTALAIWASLTGLASRIAVERSIAPDLRNQLIERFCAIILGGLLYEH